MSIQQEQAQLLADNKAIGSSSVMGNTFCSQADVWDELLRHQVELMSPAEITALAALPAWKDVHSIIDIGCGNGDYAKQLQIAFPDTHITAIDRSPALIARARHRHRNSDIEFEQGDIVNSAPSGKFDAIILRFVVQHLDDAADFFSKLQALCHDNTQVLIIEPNPMSSCAHPRLVGLEHLIEHYETICESNGGSRSMLRKKESFAGMLGEGWSCEIEQSISSEHERGSWCEKDLTTVLNGWVTVLERSGAAGDRAAGVRKEVTDWVAGPGKSISLNLDLWSLRLSAQT